MPITLMNPIAYSPIASLIANFDSGVNSLTVTDGTAFPEPPFYAVLTAQTNDNFQSNNPLAYETILVTVKSGDTLSSITRAVEGIQNGGDGGSWVSGDFIAAFWTARAYTDFKDILSAATSIATANTLIERDSEGRAKVASSITDTDIAIVSQTTDKLPLAGGTMTGTITAPNFKDYSETLATATWDGGDGVAVIDLQNGNIHSVNITVPITDLTFINARAGAHSFTLKLSQGATLKAITWPLTAAQWSGGIAPVMAINKTYWMVFVTVDGGSNWNGFLSGEV